MQSNACRRGCRSRADHRVAQKEDVGVGVLHGRVGVARLDAAQDLAVLRVKSSQHIWWENWTRRQAFAQGPFGHGGQDQVATLIVQGAVKLDFERGPAAEVAGLDRPLEVGEGAARGLQVVMGGGRRARDGMRLEDARQLERIQQIDQARRRRCGPDGEGRVSDGGGRARASLHSPANSASYRIQRQPHRAPPASASSVYAGLD